ncbi:hypothetical protein EON65_32685 [archaeon]|nr:MAG: hypothetical protein EON65_32685 [archaeon]
MYLIASQRAAGENADAYAVKVVPKYPRIFPNVTFPILDNSPMFEQLIKISEEVTKVTPNCWGWNYAGSTREIENIGHLTHGLPIVPQRQCVSTNEMGNTMGYFFNDLACSDLIGAHFVTIYPHLFIIGQDSPITEEDLITKKEALDLYTFIKALPNLVIHSNPNTIRKARDLVETHCSCIKFCWEEPQAPWLKRIDMIGKYMKAAIMQYVNQTHLEDVGTVVNKVDFISGHKMNRQGKRKRNRMVGKLAENHPMHRYTNITDQNTHTEMHPDDWLPLVPDVTIQYRCGDNLNFFVGKYGLTPFRIFSKKRILLEGTLKEADIHYIYVLTEHLVRSRVGSCGSCCDRVLSRLQAYLSYLFPNAVVLIKRGDSVFADFARIALSKVVFCSSSTFCLWPALANDYGTVFLPYTPLFAGAVNSSVAPDLGKNRKFIDIEMVSKFEGPVANLLALLE